MNQTTHYLRLLALPALALLMAACADDTDTPSTTTPDGDLTGQPIRFTATGLSVTPAGIAQTKADNTETDFPAEGSSTMTVTMEGPDGFSQQADYTYNGTTWEPTDKEKALLWPDTQNEYTFTAVSPAGTDIGKITLPTEWTAENMPEYEQIRTTSAATKTKATQSLSLTLCHALVKVQVVSTSGQPVTVKDGDTFTSLCKKDGMVYEGYLLPAGKEASFQFISDKVYTVNTELVAGRLVTACDMPGYTAIVCPAEGQLSTVWPMNNTEKVMILGELDDTDMTTIRGHNNITDLYLMDVMEIGAGAFNGCSNLTTVSLPEATAIGAGAFNGCSNLTTVSLPEATAIGSGAFNGCSNLTTVSLPKATTIRAEAFAECNAIISICLPKGVLATKDTFLRNTENATLYLIDVTTEEEARSYLNHFDQITGDTSKVWQTIYYGYKGTDGNYLDPTNYEGSVTN